MLSSFFSWLWRLLGSLWAPKPTLHDAVQAPMPGFNPDPDFGVSLEEVPRYPPFDHGLPNVRVEEVLRSQQNLVTKLADAELPFVNQTVRNLAAYVHLLPATTNDFFCGAGGLLRLCLETGFHSYVASQGNIFTSKDPAEKRRDLEPKWQLAAFLAGLCCELGRAISTSVVTNDHGQQWLPFEPLTDWLAKTNSHRYFLRPPQITSHLTDSTNLSLVIFKAIVPNEALQHITTDDRSILLAMFETVSRLNESYGAGQFAVTVRRVRDQVILRDKNTNPLTFGKPRVGVHVEPYLINGMRALVKNGVWKINTKLARVHVATDGAYVFWVTGVAEILSFLKEQGAQGMHTDPRTLGELLMQSGVFSPNRDGSLWWYIKPPGSSTVYEVIKLANPAIILDDDTLARVSLYPGPIAVDPADAKDAIAAHVASADASSTGEAGSLPALEPASSTASQITNALAIAADAVEPEQSDASRFSGQDSNVNSITGTRKVPLTPANLPNHVTQKEAPRGDAKPRRLPPSQPSRVIFDSPALTTPNAADSPKAAPPSAAGGVATSSATVTGVDTLSSTFQTPSVLVQMRKLRDLHNAPDSKETFWIDTGLAIPLGLVQRTGDHLMVIGALGKADALHIAAGESKKVQKVQRGDDMVTAIVIKRERATSFGFSIAGV